MPTDELVLDTREGRLKRMRRSVLTSARLMRDQVRPGGFRSKWAMVTLTYRPDASWSPKDVTALVKCVRDYLARRGHAMRYVWVLELQKRGAPHYHLLLQLPRGVTLPKPDKRGWWKHGATRIEWARHALGYLAKYASKGGPDDVFPKGARISGVGGLDAEGRRVRRYWLAPGYVREALGAASDVFRAPGGGWLCRLSGEWIGAVWGLVAVGRRSVRLRRLAGLLPIPLAQTM